ncbi:MAG: peptide chain release factor N(5)-glutamine methyltransferase [Actinomycetota bacterium]|nr:peptide chain release factor N(5)-glutamine methyltransferase [Actinomycetota bacterium]
MVLNSVSDALGAAVDALSAAGVDTPRLDAELLLAEVTGRSRAQLAASPEAGVESAAGRAFAELVRRRLRREPIAYILGRCGFRRIELRVDRRVLIPRPESELLVELALEIQPRTVLDVGTGSGAVALAIADELPQASIVATDLYLDALEVAARNADWLGVSDRVRFEPGSLPASGVFDLLLANLPYVSGREWLGLQPELREFEPRGALTPGPTGLEAIEALLGEFALRDDISARAIGLEVGAGQAAIVAELVRRAGFEEVTVRPDLAGIDRVVVGEAGP